MKKLLFLFFLVLIATAVFSDESSAMWTRIYERVDTLDYKYSILQNVVDTEDRELIPLFQTALAETNKVTLNSLNNNEKRVYDEIQKICIRKLGDFKAIESEEAVYHAYKNNNNLVIKTEAIITLGRMGSVKYLQEFITTLRNINMRTVGNTNMSDNEAIAAAFVNYFENIRNVSSYETVFYASVGWYTPRYGVKEKAKKALKVITDDPSAILKSIIEKDPDFSNKLLALNTENESSASDEKKSEMAVAGLSEGIRHKTSSIAENMQLSSLRLRACNMLINSSYKAPEAVPYLEQILLNNYDASEKLTVIEALSTYKSDEAAQALTKYLKDQNTKQAEGMSQYIDRRTVIATINALGNMGNPIAREELIVVTTIQTWSTAVIKAAQTALEKIKK